MKATGEQDNLKDDMFTYLSISISGIYIASAKIICNVLLSNLNNVPPIF